MKQLLDKLHKSNEETAKIHRGTIDAIKHQSEHVEKLNKSSENNGRTQKIISLLAAEQVDKIERLNKTAVLGILTDQKNLLDASRRKKAEAALIRSERFREISVERTSQFSRDRFFSNIRNRERTKSTNKLIDRQDANLGVLRDSVQIAKAGLKGARRRLALAIGSFLAQRKYTQERIARQKILIANVIALRKKVVGDGNERQQMKEAMAINPIIDRILSKERGPVDKALNFLVNRLEGGLTAKDFVSFFTFFTKSKREERKLAKERRQDAKKSESARLKREKAQRIDRNVDAKEEADEARRRALRSRLGTVYVDRLIVKGSNVAAGGSPSGGKPGFLSKFSDDAIFKALGITAGGSAVAGGAGAAAAGRVKGPILRATQYLKNLNRVFLGVDNTIRKNGAFRKGGMNKFEKGIKSLGQLFRKLPKILGPLLRLSGRFLGPIYLIIEGVIGLFTGFKEAFQGEGNFMEKLIKGLFFSVRNFVANVIGGTLDLLKDAFVFVVDLFGGDSESGWLKELKDFSIKDLIMDVYSLIEEPFLFVKDLFSKGPAGAAKALGERMMKKGEEGNIFAERMSLPLQEKAMDDELQKRMIELYGPEKAKAALENLSPELKQKSFVAPRGRGRGRGTGKVLMESGAGVTPQIINVTNNSGGNSSTTVTSRQFQNYSGTTPIAAGSAMGM